MKDLNAKQRRILEFLQQRPDRDLYEGAAAPRGKEGSGQFWVTYSAEEDYEPLGWDEVRQMEARGLIEEMWPGCYKLLGAERKPMTKVRRKK